MREIKFRGIRVDNNEWVYGGYVIGKSGNHYIFQGNDGQEIVEDDCCLIHRDSVGQFTGLKDKNGKDMYEGDVLKYYQPYSKKWENHIVLWDEKFSCFGLFENNNEWCKESDWLKIQELEIIGNIHEKTTLQND